MNKKIKKMISLMLVFVLMFSTASVSFAAYDNSGSVSVDLICDKKEYKRGETITFTAEVKNTAQKEKELSLSYMPTPLIKMSRLSDSLTLSAQEETELSIEATARHMIFSEEKYQNIADGLLGYLWSALYTILAMFKSDYEIVSIKVDGVPAVLLARVSTEVEDVDVTDPTNPVDPTDPTDPTNPVDPTDPTDPTNPVDPTDPTNPTDPSDPVDPTNPTDPTDPVDPTDPTDPVDPTDPTDPIMPTTKVILRSSKNELSVNGDGKVYFYAELNGTADRVMLIDESTNLSIADLVDDGKFSTSGDDLPGDNIYSAVITVDTSTEAEYFYHVIVDSDVVSASVKIAVISDFTDDQLMDMETVDKTLQEKIFSITDYDKMSVDERKTKADDVLDDLIKHGLIVEQSVLYNEDTATYTFMYKSGSLGSLVIKDWSSEQNGVSVDVNSENEVYYNAISKTFSEQDAEYGTSVSVGDAIILWSFAQQWDDPNYRRPFYSATETDWESNGLDTTIDWNVTIEDYKNLKGYEVIVFSGHGACDTYRIGSDEVVVPSLLLTEASSQEKNSTYSSDLKAFRIGTANVQGGTKYAILPNFFTAYYDSGDLDGSFVFAENCEFRGKNNNVQNSMSDAILNSSVEDVVGFHNSVMANYSREFMKTYVDELIKGSTADGAFETAKSENGDDDYFSGRENYGPTAYPILSGTKESSLIGVDIKNGDFELSSTAVGWNQVGDTRVITQLGGLTPPKNNRMAILTTGIGSAEKDYLAGTEGSVLSQTVRIPEDRTVLTFTYDVVSEEPTEYIDSEFDDTFIARIVTESDTVILGTESINSSAWYEIDGIDFDGGDSTTYHTMWKTVEYDLTAYVGQTVNIEFLVYDVGDSLYDTAVIIDNVCFK